MNLPKKIDNELRKLIFELSTRLKDNLVGIYVYGSLVLGCFSSDTSDVDIIVVVRHKIKADLKKELNLEVILPISERINKRGLEISFVLEKEIKKLTYPTPFEMHFSENWRKGVLSGEVDYVSVKKDPNLPIHFAQLARYGVCIFGKSIKKVFINIPRALYLLSAKFDAKEILEDKNDLGNNKVVYGILNLIRVDAVIKDDAFLSKAASYIWARKNIPSSYHRLIKRAMDSYIKANNINVNFSKKQVSDFYRYMKLMIFE
ncbi:MAG: aminoglycoside adenylyltransferase domain-containing protein [Patescibacteria group bacterium]|nr:DUF4111 domain-containing protein [Patescibacteria group bacterium]